MKGTRAASRYAKSILTLSLEQGTLESVKQDMDFINEICDSSDELVLLLKSPVIKSDKKMAILNEIFAGKISELTYKFIEIITNKKREGLLHDIAWCFQNQYREHKKILKAVVKTATGIDDTLRAKVLELVKSTNGSEVELVEEVDKDIIGGFVITIDDKQIDASVKSQLNKLRHTFSENAYIADF